MKFRSDQRGETIMAAKKHTSWDRRRVRRRPGETYEAAKARTAEPLAAIAAFVRERVERVPYSVVDADDMADAYRQWCANNDVLHVRGDQFARALRRLDLTERTDGPVKSYINVRLREAPAAAAPCDALPADARRVATEERVRNLTECLDGLARYAVMSAEHLTLASELARASRFPEHAIRFAKWAGDLLSEVSHARALIRGHQATPDLASIPGARLMRAAEPPRPAAVADEEIPF
jgi:hypothetical protein